MAVKKLTQGQSLFEVMVTLMIVSLVVTAIAGLTLLSLRSSTFSRNKTMATRYVQEANEWLRGQKDAGWTAFYTNAGSHLSICLPTLGWVGQVASCGTSHSIATTILSRKAEFVLSSPKSIQATVTVSWNDAGGSHESKSVTVFTDWQNK